MLDVTVMAARALESARTIGPAGRARKRIIRPFFVETADVLDSNLEAMKIIRE